MAPPHRDPRRGKSARRHSCGSPALPREATVRSCHPRHGPRARKAAARPEARPESTEALDEAPQETARARRIRQQEWPLSWAEGRLPARRPPALGWCLFLSEPEIRQPRTSSAAPHTGSAASPRVIFRAPTTSGLPECPRQQQSSARHQNELSYVWPHRSRKKKSLNWAPGKAAGKEITRPEQDACPDREVVSGSSPGHCQRVSHRL